MIEFLNRIKSYVKEFFPDFTGQIVIHINKGRIGSWEKKESSKFN